MSALSLAKCARARLEALFGSGHPVMRAVRRNTKRRDRWQEPARARPSGAFHPTARVDNDAQIRANEPARSIAEHSLRARLLAPFSLPDQKRCSPRPSAKEKARIPEKP